MQTAIHFEGDLAYICVSDQGEIKEEEPVTYGRSRVEFVISTAQHKRKERLQSFVPDILVLQRADECTNR